MNSLNILRTHRKLKITLPITAPKVYIVVDLLRLELNIFSKAPEMRVKERHYNAHAEVYLLLNSRLALCII